LAPNKPKLLLIGYRAYGDWIYTAPVLPYLFKKYRIHLEVNKKGYELFHDDPRFESISVFPLEKYKPEDQEKVAKKRWKAIEEKIKPDKVINLWRTLETECIAEKYMPEFHESSSKRQELFGNKNFYQAIFKKCEIPLPLINRGRELENLEGVYFTEEQKAWGERWRKEHQNDFVIVMPIAGSCSHKVYPDMPLLTDKIREQYPNAYIYLVGDKSVAHAQWEGERIVHTCGKMAFKQTIMMAKHADMVIGGETGVLVAAGMWGTSKAMLCTASSIYQTVKYHENDYSMQANVPCSPCHRAIYAAEDCERMIVNGEDHYPSCIMGFDMAQILNVVEKVYNKTNIYNRDYYERFLERSKTEIGEAIYSDRWKLIEKYCRGDMTLLDYGCASGAFHKFSVNGFKTYGYDVNPYSEYKTLSKKKFDILTMWDVIEHLENPGKELKKISAKYLFISTPNVDAVKGDIKDWIHYRPGEHLWYFNLKTLTELLNNVGYKVLEHNYSEGAIRNPDSPEDIISIVGEKI